MTNLPLENYYAAVIESSERTCGVSASVNPSQIVGSLGTKLGMILKASHEAKTHGELCARIQMICAALVSVNPHPANDPHAVANAILEARK